MSNTLDFRFDQGTSRNCSAHPVEKIVKPPARYTRSWAGITAEVIELNGPGPYLADLRSDAPRLSVVLEEIGGHLETCLTSALPTQSPHRAKSHLAFVPPDTPVWEYAERFRYIRRIAIDFDVPLLAAGNVEGSAFQLPSVPHMSFYSRRLWGLAELLAEECAEPHCTNEAYGNGLAFVIFHNLFQLVEAAQRGQRPRGLTPRQLRLVTEHMEQCSSEAIRLKGLAKLIGLSQSSFSRAFKASTGITPLRWHLTSRIQRAQQILLATSDSLADVALANGFADQSHFTRAFRSIAGESPGVWRRNHNG